MERPRSTRGELQLAHLIAICLMDGNNGNGHVVVMDHYFSNVGLFEELARNGTFCTSTLSTNHVGILQRS